MRQSLHNKQKILEAESGYQSDDIDRDSLTSCYAQSDSEEIRDIGKEIRSFFKKNGEEKIRNLAILRAETDSYFYLSLDSISASEANDKITFLEKLTNRDLEYIQKYSGNFNYLQTDIAKAFYHACVNDDLELVKFIINLPIQNIINAKTIPKLKNGFAAIIAIAIADTYRYGAINVGKFLHDFALTDPEKAKFYSKFLFLEHPLHQANALELILVFGLKIPELTDIIYYGYNKLEWKLIPKSEERDKRTNEMIEFLLEKGFKFRPQIYQIYTNQNNLTVIEKKCSIDDQLFKKALIAAFKLHYNIEKTFTIYTIIGDKKEVNYQSEDLNHLIQLAINGDNSASASLILLNNFGLDVSSKTDIYLSRWCQSDHSNYANLTRYQLRAPLNSIISELTQANETLFEIFSESRNYEIFKKILLRDDNKNSLKQIEEMQQNKSNNLPLSLNFSCLNPHQITCRYEPRTGIYKFSDQNNNAIHLAQQEVLSLQRKEIVERENKRNYAEYIENITPFVQNLQQFITNNCTIS